MDTRVKPAYDGVCWMRPRISHRSFLGPSVIAARKSLRVNGGFSEPPSKRKREAERRKAHLGNGRGLFPGLPGNRGTRQRLSASRRGVLKPWSVLPGTWQTPEEVLEHGVFAPLACPRPASSQWQTLLQGPDGNPGPPGLVLAKHAPRRRIDLRVAPPASSRSVPPQDRL